MPQTILEHYWSLILNKDFSSAWSTLIPTGQLKKLFLYYCYTYVNFILYTFTAAEAHFKRTTTHTDTHIHVIYTHSVVSVLISVKTRTSRPS